MPKIFKDKNDNVLYTGYETSEVVANPTLAGTEDTLTGLQVGETKYKVPQGGTNNLIVELSLTNPEQAGYPQELNQNKTNEEILNAFLSGKLVLFKFNEVGYSNNFILNQAYYANNQYYFNFYGDTDDNWSITFDGSKFNFYV